MKKIVIIGAGGHARETLGIILRANEAGEDWEVLGFVDDDPAKKGLVLDGAEVLGGYEWFEEHPELKDDISVVCAVGSNPTRKEMALRAENMGLKFANVIAPTAIISPFTRLGRGLIIADNAIINTNVTIGDHTILNITATISHDSSTGQFCNLNPAAHVAGNVTMGDGVDLGMGASVRQGTKIGEWAVIGAGAVVIKDIPPRVTAVGVPTKIIPTSRNKVKKTD